MGLFRNHKKHKEDKKKQSDELSENSFISRSSSDVSELRKSQEPSYAGANPYKMNDSIDSTNSEEVSKDESDFLGKEMTNNLINVDKIT